MTDPRRPLGEGAAQEAPTAPHATPRRGKARRTGPEWFWARWPVRLALGLSLVVSGAAHCAVMPFDMPSSLELHDFEGEAEIPVDVFEQEESPAAQSTPLAPTETPEGVRLSEGVAGGRGLDGGPGEGGVRDAAADAPRDAPSDAPRGALSDASGDAVADAQPDGPDDAGAGLDGAIALVEAGPAPHGPFDPQAVLGSTKNIHAGDNNVDLLVNAEAIRKNPVGAKVGFLLRGIPQWDEFMSGTQIDPVRDTDWIRISGPALVHTERDVVLIHYSATDAVVDEAVKVLCSKYVHGGPMDAGVAGVKASVIHADRAERVIVRPQTHVLVVVPTDKAEEAARTYAPPAPVRSHLKDGEAFSMMLKNPHHVLSDIPESVTVLRMRIETRKDDGVDVYIEGDTKDPEAASEAAGSLKKLITRFADLDWLPLLGRGAFAGGILDDVDVGSEGKLVKIHRTASRHQIEMVVALIAAQFHLDPHAPVVQPAPPASAPSR
jgi:hypothetical protein